MGSIRLPEEVIEDIIVKLPAKSIIRFQAVSKSWLDLIKSSRFIRKHQIESEESNLALCFIVPRGRVQWDSLVLSTTFDCDRNKKANFFKLYVLPGLNIELSPSCNLYLEGDRSWHAVGDYNGILCLTNYKSIMLVNPSWKELKRLPNPIPDEPRGYWICSLVGFGFDNMTMDFKVVRVLKCTTRYREKVLQERVEVYSLRSNSWRELNGVPIPKLVDYRAECCTFFNGIIYWSHWGIILTFNMANNLFNQLEFPQGSDISRESFSLFVFNQESLALISYPRSSYTPSSYTVNVWIMNKHGNEAETWTKLYSIGPLTQFEKPLSFWTKHKFIYKETNGKLILYDLLNHNTSVVCDVSQIQLSDKRLKDCLEFGVYRPSLVSINM